MTDPKRTHSSWRRFISPKFFNNPDHITGLFALRYQAANEPGVAWYKENGGSEKFSPIRQQERERLKEFRRTWLDSPAQENDGGTGKHQPPEPPPKAEPAFSQACNGESGCSDPQPEEERHREPCFGTQHAAHPKVRTIPPEQRRPASTDGPQQERRTEPNRPEEEERPRAYRKVNISAEDQRRWKREAERANPFPGTLRKDA